MTNLTKKKCPFKLWSDRKEELGPRSENAVVVLGGTYPSLSHGTNNYHFLFGIFFLAENSLNILIIDDFQN